MVISLKYLIACGVGAGLFLGGCRADDAVVCYPTAPTTTTPTAPTTPTSNLTLAEFARRNGVPVQTFTLPLGAGTSGQATFTTSGGATLQFPGASFLLPNGTLATGAAEVRVRELYTPADMLLSNMPTQVAGNRRVLISGGEFSIQVWQNGVRLRLAPGTPRVVVRAPITNDSGINLPTQAQLWQQPATRLVGDSAGWVRQPPAIRTDSVRTTSTYYAPIPLDSVSWWNIDRLWHLYGTASLGTLTVQTPAIPASSTGSTYVYLRLVGYNGLARLYANSTASTTSQTAWTGQLPTGANLVAAVLQSINGQLYFGSQAFTSQANLVLNPALTAVSEAQAVQLIRQL